MTDVTRVLSAIEQGDPQAAERLLPLVYAELRSLAAQKLAQEKPRQTLQATALVHEAYLRLVGTRDPGWNSRGHFFAAAAEAMRRILVESARRKQSHRKSGQGLRLNPTNLVMHFRYAVWEDRTGLLPCRFQVWVIQTPRTTQLKCKAE
jgi:RNA polymerase sigma factor (TIGR02999 family)